MHVACIQQQLVPGRLKFGALGAFIQQSVEAPATEAGYKPTQMRDHCMVSDDHSIYENAARRMLATELTTGGATACARRTL